MPLVGPASASLGLSTKEHARDLGQTAGRLYIPMETFFGIPFLQPLQVTTKNLPVAGSLIGRDAGLKLKLATSWACRGVLLATEVAFPVNG